MVLVNLKAPRGTKDIFGDEIYLWQYVEETLREICRYFGVNEIRTPIFEKTELFQRSVGETTDIVTKEMYTMNTKGSESVTLKPEGTAGAARAFIENGMYSLAQPTKLYYITPAFRYERPQAGRQRQFHQFGVEIFGSYDASCDAEVISLVQEVLNRFGINDVELKINSLGGNECRKKYNETLKKYIGDNIEYLCEDCRERFVKNPLRVLDCKNEKCADVIKDAPSVIETLGHECRNHFEQLKENLNNMNIKYTVDSKIVRGLDYYTRTVFEFVSNNIGSQSTICGGGRYDNLVYECKGPKTGAVGFAMGLERLIMLLKEKNLVKEKVRNIDIYLGSIGQKGFLKAQKLGYELRKAGICAEYDTVKRSVKAQLKYADKIKAKYCVVIGDSEIDEDKIQIKFMEKSEQLNVKLSNIKDEILKLLKEKV